MSRTIEPGPQLYEGKYVAVFLGLTPRMLRARVNRGELRAFRHPNQANRSGDHRGHRLYFEGTEVLRYKESMRLPCNPPCSSENDLLPPTNVRGGSETSSSN